MSKLAIKRVFDSIVCPILVFTIVTLVVTSPIIRDFDNSGRDDWKYHQYLNRVARKTILEYRQIALWDPYVQGGFPMVANPESTFFSPLFLFVLLFDVLHGLKIAIIVNTIFGMFGVYQLSRYLGIDKISSYLPPLVFMLSGGYVRHIVFGQHTWFAVALVPWFFLYYLKSVECRKYVVVSAVFLSLIFFEGVVVFAYSIIFFMFYSLLMGIQKRYRGYLVNAVIVLLLFILFSSIKSLPVLRIAVETHEVRGLGVSIQPGLDGFLYFTLNRGIKGLIDSHWYIGILPLILCVLGGFTHFRERWPLIVATLLMLLFAYGVNSPFNISSKLHSILFYISIRNIARTAIAAYLGISILAGLGLSKLTKKHRLISLALITVVLIDYMLVDIPHFQTTFHRYENYVSTNSSFYHIVFCATRRKEITVACMWDSYYNLDHISFDNKGAVNTAYPIIIPSNAIPKYFHKQLNPDYLGEAFLVVGEGEANLTFFSPNRFEADVLVYDEDVLILNQNFRDGWRVRGSSGPVESAIGLVSTKVSPGDNHVVFYYMPPEFIAGAVITFFSIFISILYYIQLSIYHRQ